jgi:threonine dehydrogenase-like Zn-dependent dehydrogenase
MKAYSIEGIREGIVKNVPTPTLGAGEVLIKVKAAGLCGTDGHIYLGEYYSSFPLIPGHEFSGVVAAVGKNVRCFHEGQRVVADPNIFCEKCDFCKQNIQNFCRDFEAIGVTRDGAFAEYVVAPEACVFDIGTMSFVEGALIEPLACVVYGQERVRPGAGDCVLIFGAGPIGLFHLQLVKHNGAAFVTVVDLREERLELAKRLGADAVLNGTEKLDALRKELVLGGFDLAIDTTGVPAVIQSTPAYLRNAGSLLIFGVAPPNSKIELNPYEIYKRDLKVIGSFALKKTFRPAINLVKNGMIDATAIIGEQITLTQVPEQMQKLVEGKTQMKTIVLLGENA